MDNLEIEPLSVALGVDVIFQPEVVLHIIDLDGTTEVATLESGVEDQYVLLLGNVDGV
jgi:hypothetical protein